MRTGVLALLLCLVACKGDDRKPAEFHGKLGTWVKGHSLSVRVWAVGGGDLGAEIRNHSEKAVDVLPLKTEATYGAITKQGPVFRSGGGTLGPGEVMKMDTVWLEAQFGANQELKSFRLTAWQESFIFTP